jgi:hypothetical protein
MAGLVPAIYVFALPWDERAPAPVISTDIIGRIC